MRRVQHQVRLGYPTDGECGSNSLAWLTVKPEHLVLKPDRGPAVELTPEEVVGFRIDKSIPFEQAIVVEHVAFNKTGNIVLDPVGITCRALLSEIEGVGFRATATPGVPWEPGQPFPCEQLEDVDAQPEAGGYRR